MKKIKKEIVIAFVLVICLMSGVTVFFYIRTAKVVSSADKISHIRQVLRCMRQTGDYISDVEIYTQNYLMANSHQPSANSYLADSCKKAITNFSASISALKSLLGSDTEINGNLNALTEAASLEISYINSVLADSLVRTGTGGQQLTANSLKVKEALVQLRENENRLFDDQIIINQETSRSNLSFIFIRSGLVLLIVLAGIILLNSYIQKANNQQLIAENFKNKYKTLMEGAGDAVCIFNRKGILTEISSGAELLTGFKKTELLNKHYTSFLANNQQLIADGVKEQLKKKRRVSILELQLNTKKNQPKWIEAKTVLIADSQQPNEVCFLCICRDINTRKKAELDLIQASKSQELFIFKRQEIKT